MRRYYNGPPLPKPQPYGEALLRLQRKRQRTRRLLTALALLFPLLALLLLLLLTRPITPSQALWLVVRSAFITLGIGLGLLMVYLLARGRGWV